MSVKWQKTKYPGVRFYEHESRIHNRKKDRYFAIRFYKDGKRVEEGLGWITEKMSLEKAQELRGQITLQRHLIISIEFLNPPFPMG